MPVSKQKWDTTGQPSLGELPQAVEKAPKPKISSTKKKQRSGGSEWSLPFLRPDGLVWCYKGYGEWEPIDPDTERAEHFLASLSNNQYRKSCEWRLGMFIFRMTHPNIITPDPKPIKSKEKPDEFTLF